MKKQAKVGAQNAKKTVKGKIEQTAKKTEKAIISAFSAVRDKILASLKPELSARKPYKEPFSGKEFATQFDALVFKTTRESSKFTKLFLKMSDIMLSGKEGIVKAEDIGEKYVALSLPGYELSYFKQSFPQYRIRESVVEAVENDREGGGETKGVLSFKLVKV